MVRTNYALWTYQDAVEHVLDAVAGADTTPRHRRLARRAVQLAYDKLVNQRNWSCYYSRLQLITSPQQTDGTLAYDHTGGASERLVTLSGAAALTVDVEHFELMVNRTRYEVEKYLSPTTFTLSERSNPGADLPAGTSYVLHRHTYPLPDDFVAMGQLIDVQVATPHMREATAGEVLEESRRIASTNLPWLYAIVPHPRLAGGLAVMLGPTPTTARTYDAVYRRRARPLAVERYDEGTVSVSAGSSTVTGVGTSFAAAHAGAILRVSGKANLLPTSVIGSLDDTDNPALVQGVIREVSSVTSLTLEQPAEASATAMPFTISDRLDLEAGAMLRAVLRMAEAEYARSAGLESLADRQRTADLALLAAAEDDNRTFAEPGQHFWPRRLEDIATGFTRG
jgi:hypothetical protein